MTRIGSLLLLAMLGLACEIDGSIGRDGPADEGQTSAGGTQASAEGTDGTADGTADTGSATSVGEGSGGGSGGEASTADGPSDVPRVCLPTPDDEACAHCRKVSCCPAYEACLAHDACLCWWDCLATDHTPEQCGKQCDNDGMLYGELHTCVQAHCDVCPPTDG